MMEESESSFEVGTGMPPVQTSSTSGSVSSQIKDASNTVVTQSGSDTATLTTTGVENALLTPAMSSPQALLIPSAVSQAAPGPVSGLLMTTPSGTSSSVLTPVGPTSTPGTAATVPSSSTAAHVPATSTPSAGSLLSNSLLSTPLAPPSSMPNFGSLSIGGTPSTPWSTAPSATVTPGPPSFAPPSYSITGLSPTTMDGSPLTRPMSSGSGGMAPPPLSGFTPVGHGSAPSAQLTAQTTTPALAPNHQIFTPDASLVPTEPQAPYMGPTSQQPLTQAGGSYGPPPQGAGQQDYYYSTGTAQPGISAPGAMPSMHSDSVNISFGEQSMSTNMYGEVGQQAMMGGGGAAGGFVQGSTDWINWIRSNETVNKMMEKAKSSVETMITTLDPQMKDVLFSGGSINIIVCSAKEVKIAPVRDAFQQAFGRATVTGIESQSNIAPQPVGFSAGLQGAQQRIENLRQSGRCPEYQVCVAVENFIVELVPDQWFDIGCLVLRDPSHGIDLRTFTQATPVQLEYVQSAQEQTPSDYPLGWSGLAVTAGHVMYSQTRVDPSDWHYYFSGVSRKDCIFHAARQLAYMYKQKLPKQ